jgi:hypothetical protein
VAVQAVAEEVVVVAILEGAGAVLSDHHVHSDLTEYRVFTVRRDLIGLGVFFSAIGHLPPIGRLVFRKRVNRTSGLEGIFVRKRASKHWGRLCHYWLSEICFKKPSTVSSPDKYPCEVRN